MKKSVYIIIVFMLYSSCSIRTKIKYDLPKELSKHKKQIVYSIFKNTSHWDIQKILNIPIVVKKNKIGIYALGSPTIPIYYYDILIYDGKNILINKIDSINYALEFLKKNHFSKWKQKKNLRRIKKIKHYNFLIGESQTF